MRVGLDLGPHFASYLFAEAFRLNSHCSILHSSSDRPMHYRIQTYRNPDRPSRFAGASDRVNDGGYRRLTGYWKPGVSCEAGRELGCGLFGALNPPRQRIQSSNRWGVFQRPQRGMGRFLELRHASYSFDLETWDE